MSKPTVFKPYYMSIQETAEHLGISEAALRRGDAGTDSLTRLGDQDDYKFILQEVTAFKRQRASGKRSLRSLLTLQGRTHMTRVIES